jgi:two-component system, NarL family, sensor kinase
VRRSDRRWSRSTSRTEQPRATARDLRILKDIAETLNGASDVDQALQQSLALVVRLLGLRTGWVWLIDPQTGRFFSATSQDLPPFLSDPVRMTGRRCWCIDAFRSGELTAGNIDIIECSRLRAALGERRTTRNLRYHASIPLYFGGRPLGIMNVATAAWRKLTRRELDLLATIASQVGVAIERARLAEASVGLARI